MKIMRGHILYSEKILRGAIPDAVTDIAVRHHERCDGSGYPEGLTESDLTLSQKILMVADVLSALTEQRSYKDPFSKDTTLDIIGRLADEGKFPLEVCLVLFEDYDSIKAHAQLGIKKATKLYDGIKTEYSALLHTV